MPRAYFIVFEGIDGSGTTTQAALLAKHLRDLGHEVTETREPGGTPIGERIRDLLLDPAVSLADAAEMLLYAAARAQHVAELIRPALQRGVSVICDRFLDSSLAYQGHGRNLGAGLVRVVNVPAVGDCTPDLVVFLDVPPEIASRRLQSRGGAPDRIERAGKALQAKVAAAYRELARERANAALVVDGAQTAERVSEDVWRHVTSLWPEIAQRRAGPHSCGP